MKSTTPPDDTSAALSESVVLVTPPETNSSSSPSSSPPSSSRIPLPPNANDTIRFPYLSCEVICCDVARLVDGIVDSPELLESFFGLLNTPSPLPARTAGYFEKVLTTLFRRRPAALSSYVSEHPDLFPVFVSHLSSFSIMSLLKRLTTPPLPPPPDASDEQWDTPEDSMTCSWGSDPKYATSILQSLLNSSDPEFTSNASELLVGIIQNLPLKDPILLALSSPPLLPSLLTSAIPKQLSPSLMTLHESPMTSSLNVLEAILLQLCGYGCVLPISPSDEGASHPLANPSHLATLLPEYLPLLCSHLNSPICDDPSWTLVTQTNTTVPRLGLCRLKIIRVVEALVLLADSAVDAELASSKIFQTSLDLFFSMTWCSMLHQSVANLLVHIIEGGSGRKVLQTLIINDASLLTRLLDCFAENKASNSRLGCMGHVIIVCQAIVHACTPEDNDDDELRGDDSVLLSVDDDSSHFKALVEASKQYPAWTEFVASDLATETAVQSTPLGGSYSPSRTDDLSGEDFGMDAQDMDIAASMIESMRIASGANGSGVKLGMGNIMAALSNDDTDDDDDDDDDRIDNGESKPNYYDIIDKDASRKVAFDVSDNDVVQVDDPDEGSSSDEEEQPVQNLFTANFDGPSPIAQSSPNNFAEGGTTEAWAAFDESVQAPPPAPTAVSFGADFNAAPLPANTDNKQSEDAWGSEDPFKDLATNNARTDFFSSAD